MTLYLSRLTLRADPSVAALSALIDPDDTAARADAHHRLLWSAFAGDADATRDFLWRTSGPLSRICIRAIGWILRCAPMRRGNARALGAWMW